MNLRHLKRPGQIHICSISVAKKSTWLPCDQISTYLSHKVKYLIFNIWLGVEGTFGAESYRWMKEGKLSTKLVHTSYLGTLDRRALPIVLLLRLSLASLVILWNTFQLHTISLAHLPSGFRTRIVSMWGLGAAYR